ncbi:MAG TPA: ABC transporter substrate binding protein, partial [Nitrospirota bacterium]|nr:ABC transporter substrate binding protein [Nitrospirota bacterium]
MIAAVLIAAGVLAAASHLPAAEKADKIIVLVSSSEPPFEETLAGFRASLAKQGIPVDVEIRRLNSDPSQASLAVEQMKKNPPQLIFAMGSLGTDAAARNPADIPVVSCLVLRTDRLTATAHATGVGLEFPLKTQFERLKTILPRVRTVGVIYNPAENEIRVEEATRIAGNMGIKLEAREVESPRDVPSALHALSRRVDALWGLADTTTLS